MVGALKNFMTTMTDTITRQGYEGGEIGQATFSL